MPLPQCYNYSKRLALVAVKPTMPMLLLPVLMIFVALPKLISPELMMPSLVGIVKVQLKHEFRLSHKSNMAGRHSAIKGDCIINETLPLPL